MWSTIGETAELTLALEHEGPIPLADLTTALQRLATRYTREARGGEEEPKLYVTEVRKGSIVVVMVAAAAATVTFAAGSNQLFKFADNLGTFYKHFTGKDRKPGAITKADCDDMRALAAPVIHTINARWWYSPTAKSFP